MAAAGVRRSRANPFKSTQLRQWGFICYLGGHIVSRRERTDRLRRASDGAGPREPAPTEDAAPRERLYLPRVPFPFPTTPVHPLTPLLFYGRHPTLVVDVAAIRQKSGFAVTRPRRNFPRIAHTLSPLPRPSAALFSFSFSFRNFRWKNMAFCSRFCIVSKPSDGAGGGREGEGWRSMEN